MSIEHLYREIVEVAPKELEYNFKQIEELPYFRTAVEHKAKPGTAQGLLEVMHPDKPKKYLQKFNPDKLARWCSIHCIEYGYDDKDRVYFFRFEPVQLVNMAGEDVTPKVKVVEHPVIDVLLEAMYEGRKYGFEANMGEHVPYSKEEFMEHCKFEFKTDIINQYFNNEKSTNNN